MTSIQIHNVTKRENATPLVRALQGKTYMNLKVGLAPAGGSFDVWVSTTRPGTSEDELRDMVMSVLCGLATDMGEADTQLAIAEGCDRLNDGDGRDGMTRIRVERNMLTHYGLVRTGLAFCPQEEVTSGYTEPLNDEGVGRYVWVDGRGKWTSGGPDAVREGTQLYWDPGCSVPLRKVG